MIPKNHNTKALIFWEGFPACGLLTKKVLENFDDVVLLATRPTVPFQGLEEKLGHPITWLENPNDIWNLQEKYSDRNLILHTGWNHPGWLRYDKEQKKKGAKIVVVVDNSYRGDFRQFLGAVWFRLKLRRIFDGAFVPGKSATKLMRFLGMPADKIFTGNYGAYSKIYFETTPIQERKDEFLFIGQLIKRKGVDVLLEAFIDYKNKGGTWGLRLLGSGEMLEKCQKTPGVICEGFTQPHLTSDFMNQAQTLILPSRHDNWGTVIAEAAACGMHIIATKTSGASHDIIGENNGVTLEKLNKEELVKAMFLFEKMTNEDLVAGSIESKSIARKFDENNYLESFTRIANSL